MSIHVLRDLEQARRFVLQGLWWQRVVPPTAATVREPLEWAKEILASGQPLPPIGFVADLGHLAFGLDGDGGGRSPLVVPHLPLDLIRNYEDQVLGKLQVDATFSRASDALRRYQGRDRARGLAFLMNRFRERAGFGGVEFAPGVLQAALDAPVDEILARGFESLARDGTNSLLIELYGSLKSSCLRLGEVLALEDLFELERRTALQDEGEKLARRQILRAASLLEASLPRHRLRPKADRMDVPTRILDEDTYPVGGFSSISNRGSLESLLHSQLAYMETDRSAEPDLFDIKFLRDELLYYARDENQFLRRRRSFVFALEADLVGARFKDAELPYQRIVLLLALLVVLVRRLSEWLSVDALQFEFIVLGLAENDPLAEERKQLQTLLGVQLDQGTARIERMSVDQLSRHCAELARRSLCHCLNVGVDPKPFQADYTTVTRLWLAGAKPVLEGTTTLDEGEAIGVWESVLREILEQWI